MPETILPGPVTEASTIREATCIHTSKIYDSCQSKDCLEDLRVYLTTSSQQLLDNAQSVKSVRAELLHVSVQVDPVGFNRGFFAVDLRYFYRITAEAFSSSCCRPSSICGLTLFDKRCILFGGQGTAKIFTSQQGCMGSSSPLAGETNLPTAVVEAVDPIVLSSKVTDLCCQSQGHCDCPFGELPGSILEQFGEPLLTDQPAQKRLEVTLGQFSILRLERDTQLLIPVYDYCMPEKECCCDGPVEDDPCRLFQRVDFPVNEFFPPASVDATDPVSQFRNSCDCNH